MSNFRFGCCFGHDSKRKFYLAATVPLNRLLDAKLLLNRNSELIPVYFSTNGKLWSTYDN